MMKLYEKILENRKKLNLSQEQLGEKVGVSRQTVSKWELGQTIPDLDIAKLLAEVFGITLDELLKENEELLEEINDEKNLDEGIAEKQVKQKKKFSKLLKLIVIVLVLIFSIKAISFVYDYLILCDIENSLFEMTTNEDGTKKDFRLTKTVSYSEYGFIESVSYNEYYYNNNKYKKTYNSGSYINPYEIDKIEFIDNYTYYDIDLNNETYSVTSDVLPKYVMEIMYVDSMLQTDIYNILDIVGFKKKVEFILNDKNYINTIDGNYMVGKTFDNNDSISLHITPIGLQYSFIDVDEENKAKYTWEYFDLVTGYGYPHMLDLPDLTEFTKLGE